MVYHAIGIMSGSSLDGLDLVFASFQETRGNWEYEIKQAECFSYPEEWVNRLKDAIHLPAREYQLLHCDYGHYIGKEINRFIEKYQLQFKVSLLSSHGHTSFHMPERKMTGQLGDGASIAAETLLPVVTDLRAMDVAFGGQGAPIVPIGEKFLLGDYDFYLNLGGIANVSHNNPGKYSAFDICAANRVLNMIIQPTGKEFDKGGELAASGNLNGKLLSELNELDYYKLPYPKSLANDFGTDKVFPIVSDARLDIPDGLRTYTEHIAIQIKEAVRTLAGNKPDRKNFRLLATGGGALNHFLIGRISDQLSDLHVEVIVPVEKLVNFKEALIMAFIGVLRWRQEYNVLSSVTGATRDTINGALWLGSEA